MAIVRFGSHIFRNKLVPKRSGSVMGSAKLFMFQQQQQKICFIIMKTKTDRKNATHHILLQIVLLRQRLQSKIDSCSTFVFVDSSKNYE